MRVQFEATLDDLVDLHERITARSKLARSWIRQGAVWSALISAIISGIPAFLVAYGIWGILALAAGLASVAGLISAVTALLFYRDRMRQRYYAAFREQFGNRESFPFEAELTEAGIWTRQMGVQYMFEWANVEEMKLTEDAVEFYMYGGSAVAVRKRAFASTDEEQQFVDEARLHLNASRTSSNWLR
ncbi:MAG: hypothetical protein ICV60_00440 [Pyrinomonadaceae bacterium]|nr:hypothetical protein [Pyrinomonadaceae bacterium]